MAAVHVEVGVKINVRRHITFIFFGGWISLGGAKQWWEGVGRSLYFGVGCQGKNGGRRNLERGGEKFGLGTT